MDHWADPWADNSASKLDDGGMSMPRNDTVITENVRHGFNLGVDHENQTTSPWEDKVWSSPWAEEPHQDNIPEPTYRTVWTETPSSKNYESSHDPKISIIHDDKHVKGAKPIDGLSEYSATPSDEGGSLSPKSIRRDFKPENNYATRLKYGAEEAFDENNDVLDHKIPAFSSHSERDDSLKPDYYMEVSKEAQVPTIPDCIDISLINKLFSLAPVTTSLKDSDDSVLSSTSSRRAWYRLSRHETLRQHNYGSSDESYVRVTWNSSGIQKALLDSISPAYDKDISNPMRPEPLSDSMNLPLTVGLEIPANRQVQNDVTKNDDIPSFQFSWSSYHSPDKQRSSEANISHLSLAEDVGPASPSLKNDVNVLNLAEHNEENDWDFEVFENLKASAEPIVPTIAPPPEETEASENGVEHDEDEWGEMICSPAAETGNVVDASKQFREDSHRSANNTDTTSPSQVISCHTYPKSSSNASQEAGNIVIKPSYLTNRAENPPASEVNYPENANFLLSNTTVGHQELESPVLPLRSDITSQAYGVFGISTVDKAREKLIGSKGTRDTSVLRIIKGLSSLDYMIQ